MMVAEEAVSEPMVRRHDEERRLNQRENKKERKREEECKNPAQLISHSQGRHICLVRTRGDEEVKKQGEEAAGLEETRGGGEEASEGGGEGRRSEERSEEARKRGEEAAGEIGHARSQLLQARTDPLEQCATVDFCGI
ncbi:hypothetical protein WMY93_023616 [Mugilogobius chulae]|uniref:Uncharacterized protein n=1 Tax=Mugilogobius chulae TaxID=88201 RepID=A0AAW0NFA4_9GOBI